MVGWHHRLKAHEFEKIQGNSAGQRKLASCSPWGCNELDMAIKEFLIVSSYQVGKQTLYIRQGEDNILSWWRGIKSRLCSNFQEYLYPTPNLNHRENEGHTKQINQTTYIYIYIIYLYTYTKYIYIYIYIYIYTHIQQKHKLLQFQSQQEHRQKKKE